MVSIAINMFAGVEDAARRPCYSFSGSCFRIVRRCVSIRDVCVGGQNIHFTFSTRAADMHADMQMVDCGATATTGLRFQNNLFHVAHTQKDKVTYVRRI